MMLQIHEQRKGSGENQRRMYKKETERREGKSIEKGANILVRRKISRKQEKKEIDSEGREERDREQ